MAPGFKPTTFRTWIVTHNHHTRDPAQKFYFYFYSPIETAPSIRNEMKWYVSFYINGRCQKMSHKNWFFSVRIRCQPKFFILQIRCRQFFIEFQSNERRDDTNPLALSTCLHKPNLPQPLTQIVCTSFTHKFCHLDITQCDHIWQSFVTLAKNLQVFGKFLTVYFLFGKFVTFLG